MDRDIEHICAEVGIGRRTRARMEEHGIVTVPDLMNIRDRIRKKEIDCIKEEIRNKLLLVVEWREKNINADIIKDFDEDVLDKLEKDEAYADDFIGKVLGRPNSEDNISLSEDLEQDSELLMTVIVKCTDKIMESPILREECGKFDWPSFLEKTIRHLVQESRGLTMEKIFVLAAPTQSGKASVKGVIQSASGLFRIPLVILTKGVGESIDLHAKLVRLSAGTSVKEKHIVVASSRTDGVGFRLKEERISEAFDGDHGGTLVIADTKPQVLKACKAIKKYMERVPGGKGGKFILIVDEADDMFRTTERHQVFEQALKKLLGLNPSMTVMVSATPVPFMIDLVSENFKHKRKIEDIEFFNIEPKDDYNGIEDMVPLKIDGQAVYLEQNELNYRSEYVSCGVKVGYANDKLIALYDDALSDLDHRKGVLILDCSCPRVYARGNITDKAVAVQELYQKKGIQLAVLTVSGRGISVKFPNEEWDKESWQKSLIGNVLEDIDERCGLKMPVIVFGYTKMRRGISFRNSRRVPTHMVMALGRGHNVSNVVQTLGRATFNGKNVLIENGFRNVTVLMTENDHNMCIKYQNYVNHVARRMQQGDTFAAAVTGANEKIPDSANFLQHSHFRELGRIKGALFSASAFFDNWITNTHRLNAIHPIFLRTSNWMRYTGGRELFLDQVRVRTLNRILSPDQEEVKSTFWVNNDAQRLLRSLIRLRKGHHIVSRGDILDDLFEVEQDPLSEEALTALLGRLCDISLISKHSEGEERFDVPLFDELAPFLNPEMGYVSDEDDDFSQSSEFENESSPWSGDESSFDESSFLGSKETPIILNSDDDTGLSSVSMTTNGNKERKTRSTIKEVSPMKLTNEAFTNIGDFPEMIGSYCSKKRQKKRCNTTNDSTSGEPISSTNGSPLGRKSPRKITPTKFYHNLPISIGSASGGLTNPAVSNDEERTLLDSTQMSEFDRPKTNTFIEQPEEKQHVNYSGFGNTGDKRALSMSSNSSSSGSDGIPSRRTRPQITSAWDAIFGVCQVCDDPQITRDDMKRANCKRTKRTLSFEIKQPVIPLKSNYQVECIDLTSENDDGVVP